MIGLQRLAIPSCPPAKRPPFSPDLPALIVVFIDTLPNWGLFGIIKQICHASVGILMECLPSGGWFSLGLRPRGKPSSLWETFHQDTHAGIAYLYNVPTSICPYTYHFLWFEPFYPFSHEPKKYFLWCLYTSLLKTCNLPFYLS